MKKKITVIQIIVLPLLIAAIILMTLPNGVIMIFSDGPGSLIYQYYSYFDLLPAAYANIFPMLSAILTVVIIILALISLIKEKGAKAILICLCLCIICQALSWLIYNGITLIGACVASIHIIVLILTIIQRIMQKKGATPRQ